MIMETQLETIYKELVWIRNLLFVILSFILVLMYFVTGDSIIAIGAFLLLTFSIVILFKLSFKEGKYGQ